MRRALLLFLVPLLFVGTALLPGRMFLPQAPVGFEPLASESPEAAASAWRAANYLTSDRLFPLLTDELAIADQLKHGVLPLWQPLQGMGAPLFAGTIVGPLYPPNWLRYAFGPLETAPWCAMLALFLAGLGMWLFLERRGLAFGACAIGALALQCGGWAFGNLHYACKLDAALWMPWMLWAIEGVLTVRRNARLWLTASTALAFVAGFPSVAVFCAASAALYAIARAVESSSSKVLRDVALAFALGLCIAGVQLIPMAEASALSMRVPQTAGELAKQAQPFASAATLVLPELFGSPRSLQFAARDPITWLLTLGSETAKAENANTLEWSSFAGVAVVALAAVAVFASFRAARWPLALSVLALGFAQGWPGFTVLYRLPGFDLGAPTRAACVLWVAVPWLAALGAQAIVERRPRALATAAIAALALAAIGATIAISINPKHWGDGIAETIARRHGLDLALVQRELDADTLHETAVRVGRGGVDLLAAALVALGATLLAARTDPEKKRSRMRWAPFVFAIVLEGLQSANAHLAPRELEPPLFPPSATIAAIAQATGDGRVVRFDESDSGADDVLKLARPNLLEAYGIDDLTPYVVFSPRYLVELLAALDPHTRFRNGISRIRDLRLVDHPVLDLARVTAVLSRKPLDHPRLELAYAAHDFFVYRRKDAFAPARVVPVAARTANETDELAKLTTRAFDPRAVTVLAPGAPLQSPADPAGDFREGELRATRPAPDRFDVDVRGSSGGWLVMHELWAPGWSATVDGDAAEIVRADGVCRAVSIPPGDCVVRTEYRPWSVRIGAALSGLALAAALALFARRR